MAHYRQTHRHFLNVTSAAPNARPPRAPRYCTCSISCFLKIHCHEHPPIPPSSLSYPLTWEVRVVVKPGEKILANGGVGVARQERHHVVVPQVAPLHHQRKVRRVSPVVGRARGGLIFVRARDAENKQKTKTSGRSSMVPWN